MMAVTRQAHRAQGQNRYGAAMEQQGPATVRASEIARFSASAASWWDPEGPFRHLHRMNPVRIRFIRDSAAELFSIDPQTIRPFDGLAVLDLGCGGGLASESLARLGAHVTGIDASDASITIARAHAKDVGLDIAYRIAAPEDLVAEGRTFDLVVSLEVIEHVDDVDAFMAAAVSLVRPGGGLAISTLNRSLRALLLAKVAAEYVLNWVPPGTHDWRQFLRPSELAAAGRRAGARLTTLAGASYDAVNGRWLLSSLPAVNYLAFFAKDHQNLR